MEIRNTKTSIKAYSWPLCELAIGPYANLRLALMRTCDWPLCELAIGPYANLRLALMRTCDWPLCELAIGPYANLRLALMRTCDWPLCELAIGPYANLRLALMRTCDWPLFLFDRFSYDQYYEYMSKTILYPRYIKSLLLEALKDSPAVLIHGPRQCGKTTLAQMVGESKKYQYISFDDNVIAEATKSDPIGFVKSLSQRVILDEIQKAPYLFSSLKREIDKHRIPGRFILTGSSNILHLPTLSDSLAGRMQILRLHPLSQEERLQHKSQFLDVLFKGKFKTKRTKNSLDQLIDSIVTGGYPEVFTRPSGRRRANWYSNYVKILVHRDILDLSKVRSVDVLPRLLTLSATQTAQLVNFTNLALAFQVSRPTICDYVALFEKMFFLEKLSPWYSNRLRRLIKTPKLHLCDTGLACALLGVSAVSLKKDRILLGQLLETFVFQELRRQASYHFQDHAFFHYRDKKGYEVDIVIERDHLVVGVEVKSSSTINLSDFKGLRKLKTAVGKNFVCGVILYNGDISIGFGEKFYAIPLNTLWI